MNSYLADARSMPILATRVVQPMARGALMLIGSAVVTAAAVWAAIPVMADITSRKLYPRHSAVRRRRGYASS